MGLARGMMTTAIHYLGHAGFIVEHQGVSVLIDPWFYPAFLQSWFPYPDNRDQLQRVLHGRFDYLYVSHAHEDHYDERLLRALDRSITVVVPHYRSQGMVRRFKVLGFTRMVALDHRQSHTLVPGLVATMYLDTSHKEDSGLLLEAGGFRLLDLNDCNTPMSELPGDIDLLAAQYSGAMWYPNCYDYPPDVMAQKVDSVRQGLMDTLYRKVRLTAVRRYVPCAGPACFLDPVLERYNDRSRTIFPLWEDVSRQFASACPDVDVLRIHAGDTIRVDAATRATVVERAAGCHSGEDLVAYRERRRDEWGAFYAAPQTPVTTDELEAYFAALQRQTTAFLADFRKDVRLVADGRIWSVHLGQSGRAVIEHEEPFDAEYTFTLEPRVLRAIVGGRTGWEEALLSMRIGLHRHPDVFDLRLMGLLRYGNEPVQIRQMLREQDNTETIERDGLRMQRFCPHAGEDLTHALICDGIVECPRHHWRWDARTGACVSGGALDLRFEVLAPDHPSLQRGVQGALHRGTRGPAPQVSYPLGARQPLFSDHESDERDEVDESE